MEDYGPEEDPWWIDFIGKVVGYGMVAAFLGWMLYLVGPSLLERGAKMGDQLEMAKRNYNDYQDCIEALARQGYGRNAREDFCEKMVYPD